jgi:cyclic pyranopterin phosphate synthase
MSRNARRVLQRAVVASGGTGVRLPPVRLLSTPSPAIIDEAPASLPPTPARKFLLPHAKPFRSFLTDGHDRFHNYLRISITERCNLRCTYCMPSEGIDLTPSDKLLTSTEIIRLASLFVDQGVTKIRLTGGEPTVRKDCVELVEELGKLRPQGLKEIAMTSNGIALWRKLERMVAGGLTHLNLSLDTLDPFKYQIITRRMGTHVRFCGADFRI